MTVENSIPKDGRDLREGTASRKGTAKANRPSHSSASTSSANRVPGLCIGLLANRSLRNGPGSQLISFLREFEHYLRHVVKAHFYAVGGTYRAILRAGLLRDYGNLHRISLGHQGGIVPITAMVVKDKTVREKYVDSVIYFVDPRDPTSTYPESIALKRECVVATKTFLATYSAARDWASLGWFASDDHDKVDFFLDTALQKKLLERADPPMELALERQTVALIAHDKKKGDMLRFAHQNIDILKRFGARIATGTTGTLLNGRRPPLSRMSKEEMAQLEPEFKKLVAALRRHKLDSWVQPQPGGPRGGDVQIAEAVLSGQCHKVFFFEDPHVAREHEADIQLLERTCRIPESNIMCLHDYESATEWAINLRCCISKGMSVPVTLARAFRVLFNAELVLSPYDTEGRSEDESWNRILENAAYFLLGTTAHVAREKADLADNARIAVTWGYSMHELCQAVSEVGEGLRKLGDNIASARFLKNSNVVAVPMVGIMGTTDPRVEATRNAVVLGNTLGGQSLALPNCAFIDVHALDDAQNSLPVDWDNVDIAVYTCETIREQFGTKALAPMPRRLNEQMRDQAAGEVGGLFLREDGNEIEPKHFRRIGMSWFQLHRIAERGGAILIAGVQDSRVLPALACLRGGLASTLVTDRRFAWKIIESELREARGNSIAA